ncbi:hypothetical protein F511_33431 [Dorcoceras hygrometricum]|uniref:Uncharacterized protein n=1 Tax=Dorcoceras hygrometricum TaxID=472368 RepID=A0A2Z7CXE9_9LAMI|nr:hypothetical protein F511_33431 [Dorcoceras hygrometricum]
MGRVSSRREGQLPLHIGCDFTTLKLISVVIRSSAMGRESAPDQISSDVLVFIEGRRFRDVHFVFRYFCCL